MPKNIEYLDRADRRENRRLLSAFVASGFGEDDADHLCGGFQRRQRVVDKSTPKPAADGMPAMSSEERAAAEVAQAKKDPAAAKRIADMMVLCK